MCPPMPKSSSHPTTRQDLMPYLVTRSRPLHRFDDNADERLSLREFTELCRHLFVGTEEAGELDDMYEYDAGAIFRRLTETDLAGGEDFLDEFAYKKWIGSVLAPKG